MGAIQRKFEMDGNVYQTGLLAADVQFNIARRIMPMMNKLQEVGVKLIADGKLNASDTDSDGAMLDVANLMTDLMGPIGEVMAAMPQENVDYVMYTCLSACERQDKASGSWTRVCTGRNIMFADIDAAALIRIMTETIVGNLHGFFPLLRGLLGSSAS